MSRSPRAGEPLMGGGDLPSATATRVGAFVKGAAHGLGQDEVS